LLGKTLNGCSVSESCGGKKADFHSSAKQSTVQQIATQYGPVPHNREEHRKKAYSSGR
jgi:hypothetical protein